MSVINLNQSFYSDKSANLFQYYYNQNTVKHPPEARKESKNLSDTLVYFDQGLANTRSNIPIVSFVNRTMVEGSDSSQKYKNFTGMLPSMPQM